MNKMTSWAIVLVLGTVGTAVGADWVSLFDGKTLEGWSRHSGTAEYKVEDGAIVGTAVKGSPNTFLCTDKTYGDFILEFEVKCHPSLNSGVQFRSQIADRELVFIFRGPNDEPQARKIPKDRVYGYQVEIASANSGSSGGVYDEARRAFFLGAVVKDSEAAKAFKDNEWNKYRVECRGDMIKTAINGVPCVEFRDAITARGVIGLQVHGLGNREFEPYQVRWRNIRIQLLD
jgi:hypothetical protein